MYAARPHKYQREGDMTFGRRIAGVALLGMAMLIGSSLSAPTQAGFIVTLTEQGTDVVATGSGPIDLSGLSSGVEVEAGGQIQPNTARIFLGPPNIFGGNARSFFGFSGPTSFGEGGNLIPVSSFSGNDPVGILGAGLIAPISVPPFLEVPFGYISDSPLSETATWANQTFATLGVTPGVYEWTWGPGANQSFTLDIAVPEPSSLPLVVVAFAALLLVRTSRRIWTAE
jgi:hypothetical protein